MAGGLRERFGNRIRHPTIAQGQWKKGPARESRSPTPYSATFILEKAKIVFSSTSAWRKSRRRSRRAERSSRRLSFFVDRRLACFESGVSFRLSVFYRRRVSKLRSKDPFPSAFRLSLRRQCGERSKRPEAGRWRRSNPARCRQSQRRRRLDGWRCR